jgi:glucokinase
MNKTLVLGLDLGGTKIAAGIVDSSGKLRSALRIPTPASGVRGDLAALFDAAHSVVNAAGIPWKSVRAVGVGVPGAFDPQSRTVWAPNLPGWKRVPLAGLLARALRKPTFVEADRNVQALAEAWLVHPRARDLVFLTVGTGIGAGIIADGRVVAGSRGVAGAAGWMAIEREWQALFARIGCLEALGAGPAVTRLAREAARKNPHSAMGALLRSGQTLTAEQVVMAARRDDRIARRVLEEVGSHLGRGVAGMISLLNPEVVVLGGGLAGAGRFILDPLRAAARKWGQPLATRQVRIVRSALGEEAGILGAARYALLRLEA